MAGTVICVRVELMNVLGRPSNRTQGNSRQACGRAAWLMIMPLINCGRTEMN